MRTLFIVSVSTALLSGCLTTQESPYYEHSTAYKGDPVETTQYATTTPIESTAATYESVPAQPVYVQQASTISDYPSVSPTDAAYGTEVVTGTPGFMAMQNAQPAATYAAAAPTLPSAQIVNPAPMAAAGTPVSYDYSRNLIAADAVTTGQQYPSTSQIVQNIGNNYTVQPGDTVYSLSRKTCVGVTVIQSMNGLGADYGIKIGQSLTLPASAC